MGIWGPRGQDGNPGCCLILMRFALELKGTDGPAAWKPSAISPGAGKQEASSRLCSLSLFLPSHSQHYLPVILLGEYFCCFKPPWILLCTFPSALCCCIGLIWFFTHHFYHTFPALLLPVSAPSWLMLNLLEVFHEESTYGLLRSEDRFCLNLLFLCTQLDFDAEGGGWTKWPFEEMYASSCLRVAFGNCIPHEREWSHLTVGPKHASLNDSRISMESIIPSH